jgi:menaquinone-dependent protoporphyrinogen oxidase
MSDETFEAGEEARPAAEVGTVEQSRILVAFATKHGSTPEVAQAVAEELRAGGAKVDVRPASLAAPMIFGWHKDALRFLELHRSELATMTIVYLVTAASLTETGEERIDGIPIVKDPWLTKGPKDPAKLSFRERYARPSEYLKKPFKRAPEVRPSSVAFFAGSLDLTKMNLFEKAFVMLVIGATPGDSRNWDAIRDWASGLLPLQS